MRCSLGPCDDQPMAKTVLIVDDHAPSRALAARCCSWRLPGRGRGGGRLSALDAVRRLRPGVVVLDVQLPDLDSYKLLYTVDEFTRIASVSTGSTQFASAAC